MESINYLEFLSDFNETVILFEETEAICMCEPFLSLKTCSLFKMIPLIIQPAQVTSKVKSDDLFSKLPANVISMSSAVGKEPVAAPISDKSSKDAPGF